MTEVECPVPLSAPSLLDLRDIDASRRSETWTGSVPTYFPGLTLRDLSGTPAFGMIAGTPFGVGRLGFVLSPPVQVLYEPHGAKNAQIFSIMLQISGSTIARQSRRYGLIGPGQVCVIDNLAPFELEVVGTASQIMFLQMPRHAVIGRHPHLEHCTARAFDPQDSGTALLRGVLLNILESADRLQNDQRGAALAAVMQLLGAAKVRELSRAAGVPWRVRAALALIDAELSNPELDASRIAQAQSISRRRLDELMVAQTGASLTAKIWLRRLEQAASDLIDERFSSRTVTQIAFAAGFEDAAHFTRAFKRRYGCAPREWRSAHLKL